VMLGGLLRNSFGTDDFAGAAGFAGAWAATGLDPRPEPAMTAIAATETLNVFQTM
jgi:hypothetical protein